LKKPGVTRFSIALKRGPCIVATGRFSWVPEPAKFGLASMLAAQIQKKAALPARQTKWLHNADRISINQLLMNKFSVDEIRIGTTLFRSNVLLLIFQVR
jgi:hypothetical protein